MYTRNRNHILASPSSVDALSVTEDGSADEENVPPMPVSSQKWSAARLEEVDDDKPFRWRGGSCADGDLPRKRVSAGGGYGGKRIRVEGSVAIDVRW